MNIFIRHPCLIIEVLSSSTEAYDRGKKFAAYRQIETLQEYVLIDAQKMSVECFRLNEKNKWELNHYLVTENNSEEIEVSFNSVDFHCPISLIYEDVESLELK